MYKLFKAAFAQLAGAPPLLLQPEDEENMGDVDLWSITEDGSLTVNDKWLQHLQVPSCGLAKTLRAL